MTAVNVSGTFKKDKRPDNGLEHIAGELIKDEFSPRLVVGVIVPHAYKKIAGEPTIPVVKIRAIEPVDGDDAITVRTMIDKYRKARDGAPLQEDLFDADGWAKDGDD